jgi:hypothetical protein
MLGGWCYFVYRTTGYFQISTLTGLNLTHWSGAYMEIGPSQYAEIESIYLHYRDQEGASAQTIWKALPELRQRTGMSSAELSAIMQMITIDIIKKQPLAYAANALFSWIDFWRPSFLHGDKTLDSALVRVTRVMIVTLEVVFLLGPLALFVFPRIGVRLGDPLPFLLVYSLVFATSIVQALLISEENSRYSVVVDPWIIATALSLLFLTFPVRGKWQASTSTQT